MIIEFSCVLSIALYNFITFIASTVLEGEKPDTSKAAPWLVYLYAWWEISSSHYWDSSSRESWRWFNCTQIYLLSGLRPFSNTSQKNTAFFLGPKSIGAFPVFCLWTETYPLSELSCSFVKYHRVNKVQKQTNSELKSLFVTDVTGIRVNYKRILRHFVLSQTQLMEFITEQFVIKLDIPLCVPVVSYMTGNVRVLQNWRAFM